MGRVINTDGPGKRRNNALRTLAEILRRLSQQNGLDDNTKDMVAQMVFELRDVDATIDESAKAWEKRDYWMKAEEFRTKWRWAGAMADELLSIIVRDEWDKLPPFMLRLLPHVADIKVTKYTRDEMHWRNAYDKLMSDQKP